MLDNAAVLCYYENEKHLLTHLRRIIAKKNNITVRSGVVEYLTYVAAVGEKEDSFEVRNEDENIWLTQK